MTRPLLKPAPSDDLVRLRDEIAMQALNGLIVSSKGWGYTDGDGKRHSYQTMREYSDAAYEFADQMLAARERVQ